jgi:hypothetical protein
LVRGGRWFHLPVNLSAPMRTKNLIYKLILSDKRP